jgi:hypothetical protein
MSVRGAFAVFAAVLAAVVVMAGCGSGGGSDTAVAESSISKAQYVKQAEAVCKKGNEELEADFAAFVREKEDVKTPHESDYVELFEKVLEPNISTEIEELHELDVPQGDASKVEAILSAREESLTIAEAEPKEVIENSKKVFGKASSLADEYGLKDCATR